MEKRSKVISIQPQTSSDVLTEIIRRGAKTLLQQALEAEITSYMDRLNSEYGRSVAVRNGYKTERTIQTGVGDVVVRQSRVRIS